MFVYILTILLVTAGLFLASNSPILPTISAIDDSMTGSSTGNATESTEDDDNLQQNGTISRKHN